MKVLSGILLENNRQRMDLFGFVNKAKEVSDYSIDFIAAAREGGLNIKAQIRQVIQLKNLTRLDLHPHTVSTSEDTPLLIDQQS